MNTESSAILFFPDACLVGYAKRQVKTTSYDNIHVRGGACTSDATQGLTEELDLCAPRFEGLRQRLHQLWREAPSAAVATAMAGAGAFLLARPVVNHATNLRTPLQHTPAAAALQPVEVERPDSATASGSEALPESAPEVSESSSHEIFAADIAAAIVRSKTDIPEHFNNDSVVTFRLDRHVRAAEIKVAFSNRH